MIQPTVFFPLESFDYGGVASFVSQYTSILHKYGYKTVILAHEGEILTPDDYFKGSKIVVIPGVVESNILLQAMGIFKYYYYLHKIYNSFQVDIVHFSITLPSFFCLLHFKTWRYKRICTFYGASNLEVRSTLTKISVVAYLGLTIRKVVQHLVLSSSKRILTFSNYSAGLISMNFSNKFKPIISIVPGFLDFDTIK